MFVSWTIIFFVEEFWPRLFSFFYSSFTKYLFDNFIFSPQLQNFVFVITKCWDLKERSWWRMDHFVFYISHNLKQNLSSSIWKLQRILLFSISLEAHMNVYRLPISLVFVKKLLWEALRTKSLLHIIWWVKIPTSILNSIHCVNHEGLYSAWLWINILK